MTLYNRSNPFFDALILAVPNIPYDVGCESDVTMRAALRKSALNMGVLARYEVLDGTFAVHLKSQIMLGVVRDGRHRICIQTAVLHISLRIRRFHFVLCEPIGVRI